MLLVPSGWQPALYLTTWDMLYSGYFWYGLSINFAANKSKGEKFMSNKKDTSITDALFPSTEGLGIISILLKILKFYFVRIHALFNACIKN